MAFARFFQVCQAIGNSLSRRQIHFRNVYRNILTGYTGPDMMSIPVSVGGRMKVRNTQSDPRKNPDSPRVHGLRLAVSPSARSIELSRKLPEVPGAPLAVSASAAPNPRLSETTNEGTEQETQEGQFLTVQDVAKLLRVPVSWVYGHTRKRSLERLPGYRLGKYWRFREDEIVAWVKYQRGGHHVA